MLEQGVSHLHENADLFVEVGELLRHQWIVEVRVISREDNVVIEFLARNNFNYSFVGNIEWVCHKEQVSHCLGM